MLTTSLLLALSLATPDASAATDTKIKSVRVQQTVGAGGATYRRVVVIVESDAVTDLSAELSSGGDSLTLEPEDLQVPLAGSLEWMPEAEASLELDLVDAGGAILTTLAGSLGADGTVAFSSPRGDTALDLEVQGAWVIDGDAGLSFSLIVDGADALGVAGATLVATETYEGAKVCALTDEKGNCLKWTVETWSASTTSDLSAGEVAWVWGADLPDSAELSGTLKAKAWDVDGNQVDSARIDVAAAWADGGVGAAALVLDEDPWTWMGLVSLDVGEALAPYGFAILSSGWTFDDDYPVDVSIAVDGGDTWIVPAHSYQTSARIPMEFTRDPSDELFSLEQDGIHTATTNSIMKCDLDFDASFRTCSGLSQDAEGAWGLDLVVYAEDPADLPVSSKIRLSPTIGKTRTTQDSYAAVFYEDFSVSFGLPLDFVSDPIGLDLDIKAILSGSPDSKGKQKTVAKGKVHGQFGGNEDGALGFFDNGNTTTQRRVHGVGGQSGHPDRRGADRLREDPEQGAPAAGAAGDSVQGWDGDAEHAEQHEPDPADAAAVARSRPPLGGRRRANL